MARIQNGPLLLLLALLVSASGQQPDCDLTDPAALSRCVKQLLEGLRNDVRQRQDPLVLSNSHSCKHDICNEISNGRVYGLSGYSIDNLQISFPEETKLALRATISWPQLRGNMEAELWAQARIFRKKIKATVHARPEIRVRQPAGDLEVVLRLTVSPDGRVQAVPERTSVTVRLSDIDINVNLRGVSRWVNRLIGNPADKIAELVARKKWRNEWRPRIEREGKQALEEAIVNKLGVELSQLLH